MNHTVTYKYKRGQHQWEETYPCEVLSETPRGMLKIKEKRGILATIKYVEKSKVRENGKTNKINNRTFGGAPAARS